MPSPSKTVGVSIFAWQDLANGNVLISSDIDVEDLFSAAFHVQLARRSGSAFNAGWPTVRIEASSDDAGTDNWIPIHEYVMSTGASIANTTLSSGLTAGNATCSVTSGTNIASKDFLFIEGDTDAGNEVLMVRSVASTTVNFEQNCAYSHSSGNAVTDQAEKYIQRIDVSEFSRLRVVVNNAGSGQTVATRIDMTSLDAVE